MRWNVRFCLGLGMMCALFSSLSHARWRDEGQSEKYLSFWEKKFQWESSAIEGYRFLLDQDYEIAREKLEDAISLGCPLGKVYFQLALCFDKLNQAERAIENYKKSLEILPKTNEKGLNEYLFLSHHNLGVLWLEQGRDEQAVQAFEEAIKLRPQDAESHINLGYLYSRSERVEKAISSYRQAIENDPQAALAHYNLGVLLSKVGHVEEAQKHLDRAKAMDLSLQEIAPKIAGTMQIEDPSRLTEKEISAIRQRATSAEDLTAIGNLYLNRSQFEEALSFYEQALEVDSKIVEAHLGRGQTLLYLGRPEDAQRALFQALELEPDRTDTHLQLGKVYYDLGRIQMARQEFERVQAQRPDQIEILFYLGVVHEYSGDRRYGKGFPVQKAIGYYRKVLELDPNHLKARTNLANVYARSGDWESAKKEFEQASISAGDSAYAHYSLGYIYDELGLERQSIEEYLKAIQLDPRMADAYFNLGYVYGEHQLFELAEKQYWKVLDIDRNYAEAYFNLGVLYDRYLKKKKEKAHIYYREYALRRPSAPMDEKRLLKKRIFRLFS